MRKIKAILIDPFACTIEHVEVDGDDYKSYYPLLSHETKAVDCFTSVQCEVLKGLDTIFVDDEGLNAVPERFFLTVGTGQALAGKGLIIGADENGDPVDAASDIGVIRFCTVFAEPVGGSDDGLQLAATTPWKRPDAQS
jgi:hypothetical protein